MEELENSYSVEVFASNLEAIKKELSQQKKYFLKNHQIEDRERIMNALEKQYFDMRKSNDLQEMTLLKEQELLDKHISKYKIYLSELERFSDFRKSKRLIKHAHKYYDEFFKALDEMEQKQEDDFKGYEKVIITPLSQFLIDVINHQEMIIKKLHQYVLNHAQEIVNQHTLNLSNFLYTIQGLTETLHRAQEVFKQHLVQEVLKYLISKIEGLTKALENEKMKSDKYHTKLYDKSENIRNYFKLLQQQTESTTCQK